jgi:hypothetical protein
MTRIVLVLGTLALAFTSLTLAPLDALASTAGPPAPLLQAAFEAPNFDAPAERPVQAASPPARRPSPSMSPARPTWGALLRAADHR